MYDLKHVIKLKFKNSETIQNFIFKKYGCHWRGGSEQEYYDFKDSTTRFDENDDIYFFIYDSNIITYSEGIKEGLEFIDEKELLREEKLKRILG